MNATGTALDPTAGARSFIAARLPHYFTARGRRFRLDGRPRDYDLFAKHSDAERL